MFTILVLGGIVVGLYVNSLGNRFVQWDDPGLIVRNTQIRSLEWSNIKEIFALRRASTYQPLRVLSYALDYHFWKLNPLGYHITNITLYLLTCIIIFFATGQLLKVLRERGTPQSNTRVALFAALIFAVHPVHVEAVTWLSARKEVLVGFFFFASLYCYLRAGRSSERRAHVGLYGLAFLCFVLACLSKPVAVVLPGVILLLEFSRGRLELRRFLRKVLPFALLLLVSLVVTYILLKAMVEADGIYPYRGGDFLSNFLLAFRFSILNIKLMALTINYSPVYVLALPSTILTVSTFMFVVFNLGLIGLAVFMFHRSKVVFFAVFWFYVTILPFLNIIPISTILADRYVFISSFAYCLILALGFESLWSLTQKDLSKDFFPSLSVTLLVFLVAGYSYMTVNQNRMWRDTYTLWSEALAKDPHNAVAMNGLGVVYLENEMNEKAREVLEKAVTISPLDPLVHNNLGIVYERMEQYTRSEHHYLRALSLRPGHVEARINLSNLQAKIGDLESAIKSLKALVAERPQDAILYYRLGFLYEDASRLDEAIESYKKSSELRPHIINPYESLGRLYMDKLGDQERALCFFKKGIEMAPNSRKRSELEALIKTLESD